MVFDTCAICPVVSSTTYGLFECIVHTSSFQSIVHTHPSGEKSSPCAYAPISASKGSPGPKAVSTKFRLRRSNSARYSSPSSGTPNLRSDISLTHRSVMSYAWCRSTSPSAANSLLYFESARTNFRA